MTNYLIDRLDGKIDLGIITYVNITYGHCHSHRMSAQLQLFNTHQYLNEMERKC